MFIRLTRVDGVPVWLNASFVVTVEPARGGGSIVVPIGDGLDYEVKETPEAVLAILEGAPSASVVPVPPPKALVPRPDDVSPEADVANRDYPPPPDTGSAVKKTRRKKAESAKKEAAVQPGQEPAPKASARKKRATASKKQVEKQLPSDDFQKIADGLRERKCRTVKRMRNAMKSFYGKTDDVEIDGIIEGMINTGLIEIAADGHVNWTGQVA